MEIPRRSGTSSSISMKHFQRPLRKLLRVFRLALLPREHFADSFQWRSSLSLMPRGALLYGPGGVGKTTLANHVLVMELRHRMWQARRKELKQFFNERRGEQELTQLFMNEIALHEARTARHMDTCLESSRHH